MICILFRYIYNIGCSSGCSSAWSSTCMGCKGSQVRILSPRPYKFKRATGSVLIYISGYVGSIHCIVKQCPGSSRSESAGERGPPRKWWELQSCHPDHINSNRRMADFFYFGIDAYCCWVMWGVLCLCPDIN